jgi:2-iminobutanoate/2-iminopropanoate deaminase
VSVSNESVRQEIAVKGLPAAISHYTDAVRFGDLLFVSGLTSHDAQGTLIGADDAAKQTQQILNNLNVILAAVGAQPSDVLKVTVLLTDIKDRALINPVRQQFFGSARPASTLFEVSALALSGARVEIEAIVGIPKHA